MSFVSESSSGLSTSFAVSIARPSDYLALLKPRVMSLVIFTALTGILIAPSHVNPVIGFASLLAIAVGAGASGALNMWYDADIDALMRRTQRRPIPAGRMRKEDALGFGLVPCRSVGHHLGHRRQLARRRASCASPSSSMSSSIRCG